MLTQENPGGLTSRRTQPARAPLLIFLGASVLLSGCGLTAVTSFVRGNTGAAYDPTGETLWLVGRGYELSQMAVDEVKRVKANEKGKQKIYNAKVLSKLIRYDGSAKYYVIVVEIKGALYYCRTDEATYNQTPVGCFRKVIITVT